MIKLFFSPSFYNAPLLEFCASCPFQNFIRLHFFIPSNVIFCVSYFAHSMRVHNRGGFVKGKRDYLKKLYAALVRSSFTHPPTLPPFSLPLLPQSIVHSSQLKRSSCCTYASQPSESATSEAVAGGNGTTLPCLSSSVPTP